MFPRGIKTSHIEKDARVMSAGSYGGTNLSEGLSLHDDKALASRPCPLTFSMSAPLSQELNLAFPVEPPAFDALLRAIDDADWDWQETKKAAG